MVKTRGFITIATGKKHYYEIAANLVRSYRFFSKDPLPFAIICDEVNEYTDIFDDVIVSNETSKSFKDKFLLLKLCPYDENIFIDADCLCYDDLNKYWDLFKIATDFSAFGFNVPLDSKDVAWYDAEDIGKYGNMIEYKTRMHAGVIFIRKSAATEKMYRDCNDIINNYDKIKIKMWSQSYDEATFAIAMPMNNMKTIHEPSKDFAYYPCLEWLNTDMLSGHLSYKPDWCDASDHGTLIHFGTYQTYKALYRFDVECLNLLIENRALTPLEELLYKHRLRYWLIKISSEIIRFYRRVINKLLNQHKDI